MTYHHTLKNHILLLGFALLVALAISAALERRFLEPQYARVTGVCAYAHSNILPSQLFEPIVRRAFDLCGTWRSR